MRQETRPNDIAIAVPLPTAHSTRWVAATKALIAIVLLRIAFGLIWAVVAALKWHATLQLFRL